jgi:DNA-binding NarL/FixJ family response regulator
LWPGPLGNGLAALLSALPQVGHILKAGNLETALRLAAGRRPQLVILDLDVCLDYSLPLYPSLEPLADRFLVLAGDVARKKVIEQSGADVVILKIYTLALSLTSQAYSS